MRIRGGCLLVMEISRDLSMFLSSLQDIYTMSLRPECRDGYDMLSFTNLFLQISNHLLITIAWPMFCLKYGLNHDVSKFPPASSRVATKGLRGGFFFCVSPAQQRLPFSHRQ